MRAILISISLFALASCVDRSISPVVPEALEVGKPYTVFAASSRVQEADGSFGYRRSGELSLLELTVSIPPSHTPGELKFSYADPNPKKQFTLAGQQEFESPQEFKSRVFEEMRKRETTHREAVIFVHGYNATQNETAFRAAQFANDIELPGQLMMYSWPSRGSPFGYAYDIDSMLFARDGLERFVRQVRASGVERIVLVAHSMGSALSMEMLRQAEIREPGWAKRTFQAVVLISPDLDIELFRKQMAAISNKPSPFVILVSEKDRALGLSSRLRGRNDTERLGNTSSIQKIADLPVDVINTTDFNDDAASSHFVAATSPTLLALFSSLRSASRTFSPDATGLDALIPPSQRAQTGATEVSLSHNQAPLAEAR